MLKHANSLRSLVLIGTLTLVSTGGAWANDDDDDDDIDFDHGPEFIVNCSTNNSIQDALDQAIDGDSITVVGGGTCFENILVEIDHVSLDGSGGATIDGSGDPTSAAIEVLGTDVTITGFTIRGGSNGIHVRQSASAVITDVTVTSAEDDGIRISESSSAIIERSTIMNAASGINIARASAARILDSTVTMHRFDGINVNRSSAADIRNSDLSDNVFSGIAVVRLSHADIQGNTITGNGEDGGIFVGTRSFIDTRRPNLIEGNNGFGINCAAGGGIRVGAIQDFGSGNTPANTSVRSTCLLLNPAGDPEF